MSIASVILAIIVIPFILLPFTLTIDLLTLAYRRASLASKTRKERGGRLESLPGELAPSKRIGNKGFRTVTVVISAHREAELMENSIRSVLRQDYPIKNIYISDSNLDNTKREVECLKKRIAKFQKRFPRIYYWSKEGVTAKSEKLNCLVSDPKVKLGEYVYFIDSGLVIKQGTIIRLVERAVLEGAVAATSFGYTTTPKNYFAKYFHYGKEWINRISKFRKNAQSYRRGMFVVCGASFLVRSDIVKEISIPTNVKTEDTAYTWKLQEEGHKISFAADAAVITPDVPTLKKQLRQSYRWYFGTWQVIYTRRHVFGRKSKAKSLAYLSVLPGLIETSMYTLSVLLFPLTLYFFPVYAAYFLIGDTVLSFIAPIMGAVFSREIHRIPREILHTIRHYHQILAFKYMSSALWVLAFSNMVFDAATGRDKRWGNKW